MAANKYAVSIWKTIAAFIFITTPAGILIGQFTSKWREKIADAESLADAGKWIGIVERTIILIFVLYNQFSAIGLLVAAKGIIRFNEKRPAGNKNRIPGNRHLDEHSIGYCNRLADSNVDSITSMLIAIDHFIFGYFML
jgi:hypothetical protein